MFNVFSFECGSEILQIETNGHSQTILWPLLSFNITMLNEQNNNALSHKFSVNNAVKTEDSHYKNY